MREKLVHRDTGRTMMTDHAIDFQPVEIPSPTVSDAGAFSLCQRGCESPMEIELWEHRHA
ncbi:MAG: hypothetical protein CMJ81_01975 [Planctomycetaceae bacterium]|nr:hypothetical protein [Planctomycetaceae bacterium]